MDSTIRKYIKRLELVKNTVEQEAQNIAIKQKKLEVATTQDQKRKLRDQIKSHQIVIKDSKPLIQSLLNILDDHSYGTKMSPEEKKTAAGIIKFIETRCKNSLKSSLATKRLLYRGIKARDNRSEYFLGSSRLDRRTMDTNQVAQGFHDQLITAAGGKATRGTSIFTSSDIRQATFYGRCYLIFMVDGKSNFTWCAGDGKDKHYFDGGDVLGKLENQYGMNRQIITAFCTSLDKLHGKIEVKARFGRATDYEKTLQTIIGKVIDHSDHLASKKGRAIWEAALKLDPFFTKLDQRYKISERIKLLSSELSANAKPLAKDWAKQNQYRFDTDLDKALTRGYEVYVSGMYLAVATSSKYTGVICKHFKLPLPDVRDDTDES